MASSNVVSRSYARSGFTSIETRPSSPSERSHAPRMRSQASLMSSTASSRKISFGSSTRPRRSRSWSSYQSPCESAFSKIVGFEVTPTTASSRMSRSSSPVSSISRESESIQTLTPRSERSCSRLVAMPLRYRSRASGKQARMAPMSDTDRRHELAQQLRVDSVRMSAAAKSGHPTSAMSAAELMAVLVDGYLRYDFDAPENPANDKLIFSKGHASTLLYSIYKAAGAISDEELLTYRKFGSRLEGHPTPVLPWVDVATGSLGQGLPIGVGVGLAGKYLDRIPYRVWVLTGDSELAEGSIWEAFEHAAHYELDNLTAIIDGNRLGQRGETMVGWNTGVDAARMRAFGWHAIEIDGHDVEAVDAAYAEAIATSGRPTAIVARTVKGKGVKAVENTNGYHGKPLDDPEAAINELGGLRDIRIEIAHPEPPAEPVFLETALELPRYEVGSEVATRKAYG